MNKKAIELTMQTIVVAAIALIVLFIVIIVFRTQIVKTTQQFLGVGEQATSELNATSCAGGFFTFKQCSKDCAGIQDGYYWHNIGALDCKDKTPFCCERGDPKPS